MRYGPPAPRVRNPLLERLMPPEKVQKLVEYFGSMRKVLDATDEDLKAAGFPVQARKAISTLREGMQDYLVDTTPNMPLKNPWQVAQYFRPMFQGLDQEQFRVVGLNSKLVPIRSYMVSQGLVDASLVGPKEAFSGLVRMKATAFACAHNHPSGDVRASAEDANLTERLNNCARILGIRFVDHVIVTHDTEAYYSFATSTQLITSAPMTIY